MRLPMEKGPLARNVLGGRAEAKMMKPTAWGILPGALGAVAAERGRLDATLRQIDELCGARAAWRSNIEPAAVLAHLRVDLELRFALEEADAYFGAMLRERPSLSHGIAELRHDHGALIERLNGLRRIASVTQRWPELKAPTLELVEGFRAHEHREADLLQEFFLRDDGTGED
jgi:hypothetical protein